jgi:hypothetical protein
MPPVESPRAPAPESPARQGNGRVRVTIGDLALDLAPGDRIVLGRNGHPRWASLLQKGYPNVSSEHVELTVGRNDVDVTPRPSKNHTFCGGERLTDGEPRTLSLPATIRLAGNCYVQLESAP